MSMASQDLLRRAAEVLAGSAPDSDPRVTQLLEALEITAPRNDAPLAHSPPADPQMAQRLRFASEFDEFFRLDSPFAPGLAFFGGVVSPALAGPAHRSSPSVSVSGRGMTLRTAFEGCVGEAIEFVSQLQRDADVMVDEAPERALATLDALSQREVERWLSHGGERSARIDWMPVTRLSDGRTALLPADVCVRRPPATRKLQPPFLLGTGTAAGQTLEAATLHGVLELIERDALALWWRGGRRGFEVYAGQSEFELTLRALRRGRSERTTWLLDVTTDMPAPCLVAISCAENGRPFAFGAAARLTVAEAARAALLELCQVELALHLVETKARERGPEALNDRDRQHLRRAGAINARTCALTQPLPRTRAADEGPSDLGELVARAAKLGVEFHRLDLTRNPPGVPAARIVAPALQLEPSEVVSDRLRRVVAATGGGDRFTHGTPLL